MGVQLFNKIKWKKKDKKTKNMKKHVSLYFPDVMSNEIHVYFGKLILFGIYVLDIDVNRNGNNLKLKVKSEFSLIKYGLSPNYKPYIHSTTLL